MSHKIMVLRMLIIYSRMISSMMKISINKKTCQHIIYIEIMYIRIMNSTPKKMTRFIHKNLANLMMIKISPQITNLARNKFTKTYTKKSIYQMILG